MNDQAAAVLRYVVEISATGEHGSRARRVAPYIRHFFCLRERVVLQMWPIYPGVKDGDGQATGRAVVRVRIIRDRCACPRNGVVSEAIAGAHGRG